MEDKRITIRFNEKEFAELSLLKKTYCLEKDSEAVKLAVSWVNSYIKNVTDSFFPPNYDVILSKRLKTNPLDRKVYE